MDGNGFINGNDNANLFGSPSGMNTSVPGMNSFGTDMTGSTAGIGSMPGQPSMNIGQPVTPVTMQPADVQSVPLQPDTIQAGATPVGTASVGATPVGATPVGATSVGATSVAQQPVSGGAAPASQYYQPAAAAQVNNGMPMQQGMPMQGMPMQGMPMAGMGMPMAGMGVQMGNQPLSGPIYDVAPSDIPKQIVKTQNMLGSVGSILFGIPFVLAGAFAGFAMNSGQGEFNGTNVKFFAIIFPLVFCGAGLAVMFGGVKDIIRDIKLNKKFRQIASYGKAVDARAVNVEIVSNVRVNGNSKQVLVCLWTDPETGALHTFKSQGDYTNKYYLVGQALRIYVNPGNLEEYVIDTSKVSYAAAVKSAANAYMNRVR